MSYRRLRIILENSAPDSAYARSVIGPPASWSTADYLLATACDQLAAANWQRGGGKNQRPKPIERPSAKPTADPQSNLAILAHIRERAARRKGA